jgi:hypothetical protein
MEKAAEEISLHVLNYIHEIEYNHFRFENDIITLEATIGIDSREGR